MRGFVETENGFISFQELVHQVLPKDYTAESWVERAERRSEEEQRQREAKFNPVLDHWPASLKHAQCVLPHCIVVWLYAAVLTQHWGPCVASG